MSSVWFLGLNLWQAGAVGAPDVARFPGLVQRERAEMEFLSWQAELGAKEYLGWPAPGQGHEGHAFLQIAVAGQQREHCLDEGLRIQRDEVGLVLVDALVVKRH